MLLGLDTYGDVSPYVKKMKDGGISFVMRYLKNLTIREIDILHKNDIKVCAIWETTSGEALQGQIIGTRSGQRAAAMMQALNAPQGAAVYGTVDTDASVKDIYDVEGWFYGFDQAIFKAGYTIGGYADGTILTALRGQGLNYCWLAGAMGWDGSKEFLENGKPDLVQGPTIKGGKWSPKGFDPITWPVIGVAYDPNIALVDNFGQF